MKRLATYLFSLVLFFAVGVSDGFGQAATAGTCYGSQTGSDFNLVSIDLSTGAATVIGQSTANTPLPGLAVNSKGNLYATSSQYSPGLYSVNATTGAATLVAALSGDERQFVDAIAFDENDVLYGFSDDFDINFDDRGTLFTIDTLTGATTTVGALAASIPYAGMAFDPTTGTLFASSGGAFVPDQIATINKTTGVDSNVGATGLGKATPDIAFDALGNMYGVKGGGGGGAAIPPPNSLISINKNTGFGTVIGSTGVTHIGGFTCYDPVDDGGGSDPIDVFVDIKPGACPNQLNTKGQNTINVAILGTADLDVSDIDLSSISLEGLTPYDFEIVDVSGPPLEEGPCACPDSADGYPDLKLKFKNQDILATLGPVEDEDEFTLALEGALNDATEIGGEDCVVVKKPGMNAKKNDGVEPVPGSFALEQNYPNPFNPTTSISFALPAETHVDLGVFNMMGQRVATLVSSTMQAGRHSVEWNATDARGQAVSSGLYIYRIAAGSFVQTQKMLLLE